MLFEPRVHIFGNANVEATARVAPEHVNEAWFVRDALHRNGNVRDLRGNKTRAARVYQSKT